MKTNNLYESINSSLSKLVEGTINEANREFTPEEQKDLDLIRSAIRKKRDKASKAYINKAERDALERRGFTIEGKKFKTPSGYIKANGYGEPEIYNGNGYERRYKDYWDGDTYKPRTRVIGGKNSDSKWARDNGEPNVNLIDMAKKQEERKKNQIKDPTAYYWSSGQYLLPERKKKKNSARNYLSAERFAQNYNMQKDIRDMKALLDERRKQRDKIPGVYDRADRDKEYYLDQIKQYKEKLRNIDANRDARIAEIENTISNQTSNIRRRLDDRKNRNKSESLHIRKGRRYER